MCSHANRYYFSSEIVLLILYIYIYIYMYMYNTLIPNIYLNKQPYMLTYDLRLHSYVWNMYRCMQHMRQCLKMYSAE